MTINLTAELDKASLLVRTVPVCLDGELLGALQDAVAALEQHTQNASPAQGDGHATDPAGSATQLQADVDACRAAAAERALPFKVQGLTRKAYSVLIAEHGPRENEPVDRRLGYNVETFVPALVRACLVDPAPADEAQWERLESLLVFGQTDDLFDAALEASRRRTEFRSAATLTVKATRKSAPR